MEDRLPLNPSIPEHLVEDDVGVWVTFDVPRGHHLYGMFVPVDRTLVPDHVPIQRLPGNVLSQAQKPTMDQISAAVQAAQLEERAQALQSSEVSKPSSSAPANSTEVDEREERMAAMEAELQWMRAALKTTSMHAGSTPATAPNDDRDEKLLNMQAELAKVKASLEASKHVPHAGGDDGHTTVADKRARETDEATTGTETEVERHLKKHARTSATEVSHTEYDTCVEDPKRTYVGEDGKTYHRRRKSFAERRRHSRSASPSIAVCDTQQLMKMFQECMKTTLTTVLESKTEGTSKSNDSPQVTKPAAATLVERKEETLAPPVRVAATCNPIAMHQPHMAITKFTGENWTEFIEYFDSLAEANAWSDKDKLAFLLMSIDSKPRMYARGDKGTPQTYEDVRRRLQQRYGQNEPAFNVRSQLRDIQRHPGERLEVFADRLQEVAQRGQLDPQDRDELFYFAFLNAVRDTPKMQNFIEKAHAKNRSLKLSDLLALSQEYLNRSPTALRRTVAVNVCRPAKPTGKLIKVEEGESAGDVPETKQHDMSVEDGGANEEGEKRPMTREEWEAHIKGRCWYFNKEIQWLKDIVKGKGLHHGTGRGRGRGNGGDSSGGRGDGGRGRSYSQDVRQDGRPGNFNGSGYSGERANVHAAGAAPVETE